MNDHRGAPRRASGGLPMWVVTLTTLCLLGLFVWNVTTAGPDGYPTSVIIGGLLGTMLGADQFLKRRSGGE